MPYTLTEQCPLSGEGRWSRTAPFLAAVLVAFGLLRVSQGESSADQILIAATIASGLVFSVAALPWQRLPEWLGLGPPLTLLAVVAILRDTDGGSNSAFSALLLLPILWLSLHARRHELLLGIAAVAASFALPAIVAGPPKYPVADWQPPTMWVLVSALMGLSIQGLIRDYRERAAELARESRVDPLTSLPNRRAWEERLPIELERAKRERWPVTVLLLDFDRFKLFNDTYGHPAADRLLRESAIAWRRHLRHADFLARYGGDEFCAVLPHCTPAQAAALIERLQAEIPYGQSISAGLASWDCHESVEALLERTDAALYAAKRRGPNTRVTAPPADARQAHGAPAHWATAAAPR